MPAQRPEHPGEQPKGMQFVTLQSLEEVLLSASLDDEEALVRFTRIVEPRLVALDRFWRTSDRTTRAYIRRIYGPIVFFDIANDDRTAKALIAAQWSKASEAQESRTSAQPIQATGAAASPPKQFVPAKPPEPASCEQILGQALTQLQASEAECAQLRAALKNLQQAVVLQVECLQIAARAAAVTLGLLKSDSGNSASPPRGSL